MGAAVGFGGSVWAQRRVKRTVERYLPERMNADVVQRARYLADDVREALDEGREAMRVREEELRRQLGTGGPGRPAGGRARPEEMITRRSLPPAQPGRHRSRRGARPAPIIDVVEGQVDGLAEASLRRRRGPRRRHSGE